MGVMVVVVLAPEFRQGADHRAAVEAAEVVREAREAAQDQARVAGLAGRAAVGTGEVAVLADQLVLVPAEAAGLGARGSAPPRRGQRVLRSVLGLEL
jgi:hypothetical protein